MRYSKHFSETLKLAVPVVLSQVGHVMVTVTDTAMVGQVGTVPLAASAFAGSTFYAVFLFGIGITYSITPLVAASKVKNETERIGGLIKNALVLYPITGFLMSILLYGISFFYHSFGQENEVATAAVPYLLLLAVSLLPMMVFQVFRQFLEGMSETKPAMYISLVANLINVFLNYLLIFGYWGFPELGLIGAGIATAIARVLMAVFIALYVLRGKVYVKYVVFIKKAKASLATISELLKLGLPSGLQLVFEVTAFSFSAIMAGWISKNALAAHQIALNVSSVTYMVATGISAASAIRVGIFHGKNDAINKRRAGFTSMGIIAVFMAVFGVLMIVFSEALPVFYTKDTEVAQIAVSIFIIVAFYQLGDGLQVVGLGALRGLTDVNIPTVVTLISYWVLAIPFGYVMAFYFDFGIYGIWSGLLAGLTVAGILHCGRFYKISKK